MLQIIYALMHLISAKINNLCDKPTIIREFSVLGQPSSMSNQFELIETDQNTQVQRPQIGA